MPDTSKLTRGERGESFSNLSPRVNFACVSKTSSPVYCGHCDYTLFLFYKNIFYKNIEAEICEILKIF